MHTPSPTAFMQFIDTHTHIYTPEFDADRAEVVERARQAGAIALLLPNIDEESIAQMHQMCEDYPALCYPMIGLHPTELPEGSAEPLLNRMEALLSEHPERYVAIGEVGLDFYWDRSRENEQIEVLKRQAEWAVRYDKPIMIHSRSAHRELVNTLLPYAEKLRGGVFHCFSGSQEEAEELLKRFPHFLLGIGGVLTFKKCKLPATLAATVPLERIVLETDAPYLAPAPHRGKRNEPSYIPLIIEKLSEIYQVPAQEVAQITTRNAQTTFSL